MFSSRVAECEAIKSRVAECEAIKFVGKKKNKQWVWIAMDVKSRQSMWETEVEKAPETSAECNFLYGQLAGV